MRLTAISLQNPSGGNIWTLEMRVAYGDPDLLCRSSIIGSAQGSCAKGATSYDNTSPITGSDVLCKSQIGSQFCSVADLKTTIGQRITN